IEPDDGAGGTAKDARLLACEGVRRQRDKRRRYHKSLDQHEAIPGWNPEGKSRKPDFVPTSRPHWGNAEPRQAHGAGIVAFACCRVSALMKPARASEWPCPRGSSTWRSRNRPVSRKPSWRSWSVTSLPASP